MARNLGRLWKSRAVRKEYMAIVQGFVANPSGIKRSNGSDCVCLIKPSMQQFSFCLAWGRSLTCRWVESPTPRGARGPANRQTGGLPHDGLPK